MGEIITFYSYKGGVGRTMALANTGVLLAQWGYKVLMIDWDLEAPGLDFFFKNQLDLDRVARQKGVIDLLDQVFKDPSESQWPDWQDYRLSISLPNGIEPLHLLTAGDRSTQYFGRVRNLNLYTFYSERKGGAFIEALRSKWQQTYDYVLIDSRTGITDIGGVCTIQLPDFLVLLFTANEQSFKGVIEVAEKARQARQRLAIDRPSLVSIPIPGKFDTTAEFKISQKWLNRFATGLAELYDDWLPSSVTKRDILEITKIPYVPYFSFGEKLPVLEQGTTDPTGLGYAYENLAALIANNLEFADQLIDNRDEFVKSASKTDQIFLSYAKEDEEQVEGLYSKLSKAGLKPWMAKKDILPGEKWGTAIQKVIQRSNLFLVCLSTNSADKNGFLKKEIEETWNIRQERLDSNVHIIPVRLEECEVPEDLSDFKGIDLFEEKGWPQLVETIQTWLGIRTDFVKPDLAESPPAKITVHLTNPFIYSTPVPPEKFIGREREIEVILDRLANPYNRGGSTVTGPSGIGKTSLLHYLRSNYTQKRVAELSPDRAHFIYIPLGFISPFSEIGFWDYLFSELVDWLGSTAETDRIIQSLEAGKSPSRFYVSKFFESLGRDKNKFAVVLLDGFDLLMSDITEDDTKQGLAFLQTLRALLNLPAPRGFSLITSSERDLFDLFGNVTWFGSDFDNNMLHLPLGPFNEAQIEALLNSYLSETSITFNQADRKSLKQKSAGIPQKLQEVAYQLFNHKEMFSEDKDKSL